MDCLAPYTNNFDMRPLGVDNYGVVSYSCTCLSTKKNWAPQCPIASINGHQTVHACLFAVIIIRHRTMLVTVFATMFTTAQTFVHFHGHCIKRLLLRR